MTQDDLVQAASEQADSAIGHLRIGRLPSVETMLCYADILEKPKFDVRNGIKYRLPNGEIIKAAIEALRFCGALRGSSPERQK